jgi:PAS domain-containing protein
MSRMLSWFGRGTGRDKTSLRKSAHDAVRPAVEGLERRDLLSLTSSAVAEVRDLGVKVPDHGVRVIIKNINSVFERVNRTFAEGLGTTPQAIVGKNDYDFYPASLAASYVADDQSVLASGKPRMIRELNLVDGQIVNVITEKVPIFITSGPAKGLEGGLLIVSWDAPAKSK